MSAGHGHGGGEAIGEFFSEPQTYKGTVASDNYPLIGIPEQLARNGTNAISQVRRYVQDAVHPILSAAKDITLEGLNFKKHGWKAPFKGLAGATVNVLESGNRAVKGILDAGTGVYKNVVIDSVNSFAANTTDNLGPAGYWIGNIAKFGVSLPAYVTDFVSHAWENYGPSKWLQVASKAVANTGRQIKTPRLVVDDGNHGHDANDNHGDHGHEATGTHGAH